MRGTLFLPAAVVGVLSSRVTSSAAATDLDLQAQARGLASEDLQRQSEAAYRKAHDLKVSCER